MQITSFGKWLDREVYKKQDKAGEEELNACTAMTGVNIFLKLLLKALRAKYAWRYEALLFSPKMLQPMQRAASAGCIANFKFILQNQNIWSPLSKLQKQMITSSPVPATDTKGSGSTAVVATFIAVLSTGVTIFSYLFKY